MSEWMPVLLASLEKLLFSLCTENAFYTDVFLSVATKKSSTTKIYQLFHFYLWFWAPNSTWHQQGTQQMFPKLMNKNLFLFTRYIIKKCVTFKWLNQFPVGIWEWYRFKMRAWENESSKGGGAFRHMNVSCISHNNLRRQREDRSLGSKMS